MTHPNLRNYILIDVLTAEEAYQLGIIPLKATNLKNSFKDLLASMSPEEARRARRKFRKLWRSLSRRASDGPSNERMLVGADASHRVGLGAQLPTKSQTAARKVDVFLELRRRARIRAAGG